MADIVDHDDPERDRARARQRDRDGRERGRDGRDDDDHDDHDHEARRQRRVRKQRRAVLMQTITEQLVDAFGIFDRLEVQQVVWTTGDGPYRDNFRELMYLDPHLSVHEEDLKQLLEEPRLGYPPRGGDGGDYAFQGDTLTELRERLASYRDMTTDVRRFVQGIKPRLQQEGDKIRTVLGWLEGEGRDKHRDITQMLQELQQLIDADGGMGTDGIQQADPQEHDALLFFSIPDKRVELARLDNTLRQRLFDTESHQRSVRDINNRLSAKRLRHVGTTLTAQLDCKVEKEERTFIYESLQRLSSSSIIPRPRPPPPRPPQT